VRASAIFLPVALLISNGMMCWCGTALASDRLDVLDQDGRRSDFAKIDKKAGRLDLFDDHSKRIGWGRQAPDGSVGLFDKGGSRLGVFEPHPKGQSSCSALHYKRTSR